MPVTSTAEAIYLDTSALIKRYVPEANSEAFEIYLAERSPASISRLTLVELRSGLARKRRANAISPERELAAAGEIRLDIQDGLLQVKPSNDHHFVSALYLIEKLQHLPLRTLDALHLAIAQEVNAKELATADNIMARAAQALNLRVAFFGKTL